MEPKKALQALRWLENSALKNQDPKMGLEKAPQAPTWLEHSSLKNQAPKIGLKKEPQAPAQLEDSTLNSRSPKMGPQKHRRHCDPLTPASWGLRHTDPPNLGVSIPGLPCWAVGPGPRPGWAGRPPVPSLDPSVQGLSGTGMFGSFQRQFGAHRRCVS